MCPLFASDNSANGHRVDGVVLGNRRIGFPTERVTSADVPHVLLRQLRVVMGLADSVTVRVEPSRGSVSACGASSLDAILSVLGIRAEAQVRRIAARRVIAIVENLQAFGDGAVRQFPRDPMCQSRATERCLAAAEPVSPVVVQGSDPHPTVAGLIDVDPEAIFERSPLTRVIAGFSAVFALASRVVRGRHVKRLSASLTDAVDASAGRFPLGTVVGGWLDRRSVPQSALNDIGHILGMAAEDEVVGVTARRVVACVPNDLALGNRAVAKLVNEPMSLDVAFTAPAASKVPVASAVCRTLPLVAFKFAANEDLVKQSKFKWATNDALRDDNILVHGDLLRHCATLPECRKHSREQFRVCLLVRHSAGTILPLRR